MRSELPSIQQSSSLRLSSFMRRCLLFQLLQLIFRVTSIATSNQRTWCWPRKVTPSLRTLACAKRSPSNYMVFVRLTLFLGHEDWRQVGNNQHVLWYPKFHGPWNTPLPEVWCFCGLVIFSKSPNLYSVAFCQVGSGNPSFQHAGRGSSLPGSWWCSLQED